MKDLKTLITKRNEVFGDMSPKININLTIDLPNLKEKMVKREESRSEKLKQALNDTNNTMVEKLISKLKENPIYVKSGSDHIGGGA